MLSSSLAAPLAIYIHWPFCAKKCPYCDFNSHVSNTIDPTAWQKAYEQELKYYRFLTGPRRVESVFFGGGTPSLMPPFLVESILKNIHDFWGLEINTEVTLEANPGSVETDKLAGFKTAGVSRLSIGIQSLEDSALKFLGRIHSAADGFRAINIANSLFDRVSFDLIYARPNQTTAEWKEELTRALGYATGHLSLYQLTIEPETPFYIAHSRGEFSIPDEDLSADLYILTEELTTAAGLPSYEISNYARMGHESRHNLTYWHYDDYIGIGPGAHGRITLNGVKYATRAHRAPDIWRSKVKTCGHGAHPFTPIDLPTRGVESLMMGLRLTSGFDLLKIEKESSAPWTDMIVESRIITLVDHGDMIRTGTHIQLTRAGRLRLNQILLYLLHG